MLELEEWRNMIFVSIGTYIGADKNLILSSQIISHCENFVLLPIWDSMVMYQYLGKPCSRKAKDQGSKYLDNSLMKWLTLQKPTAVIVVTGSTTLVYKRLPCLFNA